MKTLDIMIPWEGWKAVRRIGSGSFGTVYEIERELHGEKEKSALKVITIPNDPGEVDANYADGYDDASIRDLYKGYLKEIWDEYNLMRKLKGHPNVVSCEDYYELEHSDEIKWDVYIRMELLTTLQKHINNQGGKLSEQEIIKLGKDICKALVACDEKNIVHRDVKPGNILVSEYGDFKLGDFGVARTMDHTTHATKAGAELYMAPEVIHDESYGKDVDVYSLGLVMYWLLNGRRMPFEPIDRPPTAQEKKDAYFRRVSGESLPNPADGSDALKNIVLKACAYKKEDRYQSAGEMLADLESNGSVVMPEDPSTESGTPHNGGKTTATTKGSGGGTGTGISNWDDDPGSIGGGFIPKPNEEGNSSTVGTKGKNKPRKPNKTGSQPAKPTVVAGDPTEPPKAQTLEVKKEETVFDVEVIYELCVLIWTGFVIWLIYKRGTSTYFNQGLPDSILAFFMFFSPVISYILIQLPKIPYISAILCAIGGFISGYVLMIPFVLLFELNESLSGIVDQLPFWIMYPLLIIGCFIIIGFSILNAITAVKLLNENNA